jgi:exonuclease SbcC
MIKLGKLRVENFKSFEDSFTVDFNGNDLLILDGPNGFGKTTLFDAIELCFTRRIGRILSTDRKQKNSHLLKNKAEKETRIFLELIEENSTKVVVYVSIPPNTSKDDNRAVNCSVSQILLKEWPNDFTENVQFNVLDGHSLNEIVGNDALENTFDLFNYIQQEETCHFLKISESDRHKKINYLFGTTKQNDEKEQLQNIKNKLSRKLTQIDEKIGKQLTYKKAFELDFDKEFGQPTDRKDIVPTGLISKVITFEPKNSEQIGIYKNFLREVLWISNNIDEFHAIEFNNHINYLCENRIQGLRELQDLILVGHLSSFNKILKIEKHVSWLNKLVKQINEYETFNKIAPESPKNLTTDVLSQFKNYFPKLVSNYALKIEGYFKLQRELGSYQQILNKIYQSRESLQQQYQIHINNDANKTDISCPFCGDVKLTDNQLWIEYASQTKVFEGLKSDSLTKLEEISVYLVDEFISKCIDKSSSFINKYQQYVDLLAPLSSKLITEDRWEKMQKIKDWLIEHNVSFESLILADNAKINEDELRIKLSELQSNIRRNAKAVSTEKSVDELKKALQFYGLSVTDKLIKTFDDTTIISSEDIKQDLDYIALTELHSNSSKHQDIILNLSNLDKQKKVILNKELVVKSLFNKYKNQIKDYEKIVAKQVSIPFYIYSSKVLQTRPDGNGVFLQSAENNRENGYLRFVSNLNDDHDAWNTMSSGQLSGLVISFMLAMNKVYPTKLSTLLIDDPVQTMDEINLASFVQLLRNEFPSSQVVISTHERKSANYFAYKYQKNSKVELINMKSRRLN